MIPPELIATVRDRTDMIALLAESLPSLQRKGRSFVALCPFHAEKTPSFHVNPERGFFCCFGCKESGSVIDFVMKQEGFTFPEAVRFLADRAGIALTVDARSPGEQDHQKRQNEELFQVNQIASLFFEQQLREHPDREHALAELARRSLNPSWGGGASGQETQQIDAAIQHFRIGYAPSGWDGLALFLKAQRLSPVVAEQAGLLVPRASGGHYDRFRHRLMFPVLDRQGRVVAFSGRLLPDLVGSPGQSDAHQAAKYINSPETSIYSKGHHLFGLYQAKQSIRQEKYGLVVEGNFDVLALHARGITHAVAPLGTAFTAEQARLLTHFCAQVVLLFDGDAAGRKAVTLARTPLRQARLRAKVAVLPQGVDPDTWVQAHGATTLLERVGQARGLLEHLIAQALDETFVRSDAQERARRVTEVAQLLKEEEEPLVQGMAKAYADELAGRLDLIQSPATFRTLEGMVRKALQGPASPKTPSLAAVSASTQAGPPSVGAPERREMVGVLVEYPALVQDLEVREQLTLLSGRSAQVVAALQSLGGADPCLDGGESYRVLLERVPPAMRPFVAERLASPLHATVEEAKQHLLQNAHKLRNKLLSQETQAIAVQQRQVVGDWASEADLAHHAMRRAKRKHGLPIPD